MFVSPWCALGFCCSRTGAWGHGGVETWGHRDTGHRDMVTCLCPPDRYALGFLPRENGVHSIDLRFNGRHVPGSPFNIRVGEQSQAGDPGLVTAFGPGLEGGRTGDTAVETGTGTWLWEGGWGWRLGCGGGRRDTAMKWGWGQSHDGDVAMVVVEGMWPWELP